MRSNPSKLRCLQPSLASIDTRIARTDKQVDAVYDTPEHRAWSRTILRRARGICQSCGRTGTRLFADHIVEIKDGGAPTDLSNGQALCGSCHSTKTAAERARRVAALHLGNDGGRF